MTYEDKILQLFGYDLTPTERMAFGNMRKYIQAGCVLSKKQRAWVDDVMKRFGVDEPENLFSSGKAPIGNPVPTPDVLKNLPLRPPGRR